MNSNAQNQRPPHAKDSENLPRRRLPLLKKIKVHLEEKWFEWLSAVGIGLILVWISHSTDEKVGKILAIALKVDKVSITSPTTPPHAPAPSQEPPAITAQAIISKDTPIYVVSDYSALDSQIAADDLLKILRAYRYNVVTSQDDAKVLLRIENVTGPECPVDFQEIATNPPNNTLSANCKATINVIAQPVQGNAPLFALPFSGKSPEYGDADGTDGGQGSINDAASNLFAYISGNKSN